jgi:hypothetical protein
MAALKRLWTKSAVQMSKYQLKSLCGGRARSPGSLRTPLFAQDVAKAFADAQAKRHDADYDLNKVLSATDARLIRLRVRRAIKSWRDATAKDDKDFKTSLCMLMLLKGQLRKET